MKYLRNADVVARSVAGENLLVPVHGCTRRVYTLNGVGYRLWDLIARPCTEDELAEALVEAYLVSREKALSDVRAFLGDLMRMGLVNEQQ